MSYSMAETQNISQVAIGLNLLIVRKHSASFRMFAGKLGAGLWPKCELSVEFGREQEAVLWGL